MALIDNPTGTIYLRNKEQFVALCIALGEVSDILGKVDEDKFNDGKVRIEIGCVTDKCFKVEVGGLLNVPEKEIQEALDRL